VLFSYTSPTLTEVRNVICEALIRVDGTEAYNIGIRIYCFSYQFLFSAIAHYLC
jgi:hypothetical protein